MGIATIDSNYTGMVLCMSCIHEESLHDLIGVTGILTNDGHRWEWSQKILVVKMWLQMDVVTEKLVMNGCGCEKVGCK